MSFIWISILVLGAIGLLAALLLYVAAKKFYVYEDPRIAEIEAILPGANCGGCGYSGCSAFAKACTEATSLQGMNCTGIGTAEMERIADVVGLQAGGRVRKVAAIRCNAACEDREPLNHFEGLRSCASEHSLYQGEQDCTFGCLGLGDCIRACPFGAMTADEKGFPVVDIDKCTGCGKCGEACPRDLPVLVVPKNDDELIYVSCANHNRGPQAMKDCSVSCIGCGKCVRTCTHDAIKVTAFLADIDSEKCVGCGECIEACPRHSIVRKVYAIPSTVEREK